MKIKVRTKDLRISIPVPVSMAGLAVKMLPEKAFEKMRQDVPEPYKYLITKDYFGMIVEECIDVLKANKGLEMVHVEASDGTFVSIRL